MRSRVTVHPCHEILLVAFLFGRVALSTGLSAPPSAIDYQGRVLVDQAAFSGTGYFKFALSDELNTTNRWAHDGTARGEPAGCVTNPVAAGRFSLALGAPPMVPLAPAVFAGAQDLYLRLWFSRDGRTFHELLPKQRLLSVPYALNAAGLGGKAAASFWQTGGNVGGSGVLGTTDATPLDVRVNNTTVMLLTPGGRVGIGTNAPAAGLHVATDARFERGIGFVAPLGDLSMGVFTNAP